MAHLYILQDENGRYYVGSTTNLPKRLQHHQGGYTPSTKVYRGIGLVFAQEYETLREAKGPLAIALIVTPC